MVGLVFETYSLFGCYAYFKTVIGRLFSVVWLQFRDCMVPECGNPHPFRS